MTSIRTNSASHLASVTMTLALVLAACSSPTAESRTASVVVEGLRAEYSLEKLATESEVVVIVQVVRTEDRANSGPGEPVDQTEHVVHHFSSVDAVEQLRGPAVREVVQAGGQVDDFRFTIAGTKLLQSGQTYLLFLTDWLWPIGDDYVSGYGITGGPAGTFTRDGANWVNGDGLELSLSEIHELLKRAPNDPGAGAPLLPSDVDKLTKGGGG